MCQIFRKFNRCEFAGKCEHYRITSNTCNFALDKTYCGKYRQLLNEEDDKL